MSAHIITVLFKNKEIVSKVVCPPSEILSRNKSWKTTFAASKTNFIKLYKNIPQNACICCYENSNAIHETPVDVLPAFKNSVKDIIGFVFWYTSSFECTISGCVICDYTIEELFKIVRNTELFISYCHWKNVDKQFEKVPGEKTTADCL